MGEYRLKDLLRAPNILSGVRLPLALAFPFASRDASLALGVLGCAAATDILDGWLARKLGQVTPVGAVIDGIADKAFAASVLGTLVATHTLSPVAALLLATRELAELPLALGVLARKHARLGEVDRRANKLGKIATCLEFATIVAFIVRAPGRTVLLALTATTGAAAAASYWMRELRGASARSVVNPS